MRKIFLWTPPSGARAYPEPSLTHFSWMNIPISIGRTSLFQSYGCWVFFHFNFYSNSNRTFCEKTVETLIRRRVLRRLIWVCAVCLCRITRRLGLNGWTSTLFVCEQGRLWSDCTGLSEALVLDYAVSAKIISAGQNVIRVKWEYKYWTQLFGHFIFVVNIFFLVSCANGHNNPHQNFCLIWFFMSQLTIFQLSRGQVFLGWTSTKQRLVNNVSCSRTKCSDAGEARSRNPSGLESSTLPLSHCAPPSPTRMKS